MITIRPHITEKTLKEAGNGWYTFSVSEVLSKQQIAVLVSKTYNVKVRDVKTAIMHGKSRRAGKRMRVIHRPDWKKAWVRLEKGQRIDAFEAIAGSNEDGQKAAVPDTKTRATDIEMPKTDVQSSPKTERRRGDYAK